MIQALVNSCAVVTCTGNASADDAGETPGAALVWEDDTIRWIGDSAQLVQAFPGLAAEQILDAGGALVIPGLVDCHTHLAFGGWRADEFALRCRGASYLDIARAGGGIARTVAATRSLDEPSLCDHAAAHLQEMLRLGVTTVECKSGYGLTVADELKLLRVYRSLAERGPTRLVATFLGAHVVPPEFKDRRSAYVDLICDQMIPQIAREQLARFCDVFVEDGAFSRDEARRILTVGLAHGLQPKVHADQLRDGGGALLAAELGAVSADHLEFTGDEGIRALAAAGVVAVALPLASLYLRQTPLDGRKFLEQGGAVAVASDFNPGTAPSYHLPLVLTLACTMNQLTPAQALKAATLHAARAVGLEGQVGSLEVGKKADFVLVDAPSVNHLAYQFRANPALATFLGGTCVAGNMPDEYPDRPHRH